MRSHYAAGHSANVIPEQRDLVPVANSARHTAPPTLSPNAATRATGAGIEVDLRAGARAPAQYPPRRPCLPPRRAWRLKGGRQESSSRRDHAIPRAEAFGRVAPAVAVTKARTTS
jgi:hypothetical protein